MDFTVNDKFERKKKLPVGSVNQNILNSFKITNITPKFIHLYGERPNGLKKLSKISPTDFEKYLKNYIKK